MTPVTILAALAIFAILLAGTTARLFALDRGEDKHPRPPKPKTKRRRAPAHPSWMWEAQYHG